MSALLIHFGIDDCHRTSVLKEAGYWVEECPSVPYLHSTLIEFPIPDAVAIAEHEELEDGEAITLIRSTCAAPLILFQGWGRCFDTSAFNLVVPPLTDPRVWLEDVASLIEQSRANRKPPQSIRANAPTAVCLDA
jgi:hypothetical protein